MHAYVICNIILISITYHGMLYFPPHRQCSHSASGYIVQRGIRLMSTACLFVCNYTVIIINYNTSLIICIVRMIISSTYYDIIM